MGMFDYLRCRYPLPGEGNAQEFQTKDTDQQFCDHYEIREDGTLWREDYDTVDLSDKSADPGSLEAFAGCMARVNERWVPDLMTGEVRFYAGGYDGKPRYEFSAYFVNGALKHLETIEAPTNEVEGQATAATKPARQDGKEQ